MCSRPSRYFDTTINGGVSKFLSAQTNDLQNAHGQSYGALKGGRALSFAINVCDMDNKMKHIRKVREPPRTKQNPKYPKYPKFHKP